MASIRTVKGKKGVTYQVQVRRTGQAPLSKNCRTKTEAREWGQAREVEIANGKNFKTSVAKEKTVKETIDRYRSTVLAYKKPGSQRSEKSQLEFWEQELGSMKLSQLRAPKIVECQIKLLAKKRTKKDGSEKSYTPRTVNAYGVTLSSVCSAAMSWGWINEHPMRGKVKKFNEGQMRERYLSRDERVSLLDACERVGGQMLPDIVNMAICTGMRKGELMGLRWSSISLERERAFLSKTKTGKPRPVPLTGQALEIVNRRHAAKPAGDGWLFPSAIVDKPYEFKRAWEQARELAGLMDFHFHDLRHTFASYMALGGANLLVIQQLLGHSSSQMTERYAHLTNDHLAIEVAFMTAKL